MDIFLKLKPPIPGDIDYTIYLGDILYKHKWLRCEVCRKLIVIKKGFSFVRVMKRLGWIYKPDPKRSRKKWQQKMWQCPECQNRIGLDEYVAKRKRLSDIVRLEHVRKLTVEQKKECLILHKELAQYNSLSQLSYLLYKNMEQIEWII